jgi:DNA polymerase-3 subunit epsilon
MVRQLLLDTETTGFEPSEGHRIIEFAALEMIDRELTGKSLHLYFNPERDIPQEATNVHGIKLEDVAHEPTFKERVSEIIEYIDGAELIIHNAKFDLKFLDHHFTEVGKKPTLAYAATAIDTLTMARNKFPGAKNNLDALCDRFNVDRSNRGYHGALIDCELLAHVYIGLTREQISLLAEETKQQASTNKVFKSFASADSNLIAAKLSDEEHHAHFEYLKQLDKTSKGSCLWYNKSKEFINE